MLIFQTIQPKIHNRKDTPIIIGPGASWGGSGLMRTALLSCGWSCKCMGFWGNFLRLAQYICCSHALLLSHIPKNLYFVQNLEGSTNQCFESGHVYMLRVYKYSSKIVSSSFVALWIIGFIFCFCYYIEYIPSLYICFSNGLIVETKKICLMIIDVIDLLLHPYMKEGNIKWWKKYMMDFSGKLGNVLGLEISVSLMGHLLVEYCLVYIYFLSWSIRFFPERG